MLLDYEKWFISDGGSQNSGHFYLRNLRAIFNKAVSEKTPQIYIDSFNKNLIRHINRKVTNLI